MEYCKIITLLDNTSKQLSEFRTKNWVEIMMNQEEHAILIVKLNLKPQCYSLVYVVIVTYVYLLKEI